MMSTNINLDFLWEENMYETWCKIFISSRSEKKPISIIHFWIVIEGLKCENVVSSNSAMKVMGPKQKFLMQVGSDLL